MRSLAARSTGIYPYPFIDVANSAAANYAQLVDPPSSPASPGLLIDLLPSERPTR